MAKTVLINGVNYSWTNIKCVLFGVPLIGITAIDYKVKQAKTNNFGMGDQPISRGYGNKEPDASIELYTDEWRSIIAAAPSRDPLDIPFFDIQVMFGGSRVQNTLDVLKACEFMEDPFSAKQGDSKLLIKIPLIIAAVDHKY